MFSVFFFSMLGRMTHVDFFFGLILGRFDCLSLLWDVFLEVIALSLVKELDWCFVSL